MNLKSLFQRILRTVAPYAGFILYKSLYWTWRIEIRESEDLSHSVRQNEPMIYAHWHGDELGILYLLPKYRSCAMISTSDDGEIMDRLVRLIGAETSRGSSTRGGIAALRGILRLAKMGYRPSVAVDGPKGPRHKVKPGVFEISKLIGGRVFPLTVACSSAWRFEKSWNKTYLPKPFARLVVVWGPALSPITRETDAHSPELAERLERELAAAGRQAVRILAGADPLC